ncbi:MAG TPA: hypothetical protein VFD66_06475, partial [Verrucomicrobiae bacterium]|nr:hypothetical protein [Verrucomicrobiae bacterium]
MRNISAQIDMSAEREGFYTINWVSYYFTGHLNGRWQPWDQTLDLQLRKKGQAIPMIAKRLADLSIP